MKAVIFAGGIGSRMWPLSRKNNPKQFQLLIGRRSIFQQTIDRVKLGFKAKDIFISTGQEYEDIIKEQVPEIPESNLILEPERRDSLGAVGFATAFIHKKFPGATIAAIWGADHLVEDNKSFIKAIEIAGEVAEKNQKICKIDTRPTFPSTYNGWVEIGKQVQKIDGHDVYEFVRFIEKPDDKKARQLFRSVKYLINVGYMVWPAKVMLELYKKHTPETYRHLETIMAAIGTRQEKAVLKKEYKKIEKDSVDYGIFEKLKRGDMLVIPTDMGWTDIGTWGLLYSGLAKEEDENITQGNVELIDSGGNLVWSTRNKTIALVGVKDIVVVDSADSILICHRNKTGDIKKLVEYLKKNNKKLV